MLRTYLSFKINEIYDVADLDDNEVWPIQGNGGCFPIPKEYCVIDGICQDKINEDKMNNIVKAVMSQPVNPANRSQKHHIEFFRGRNNTDYRK